MLSPFRNISQTFCPIALMTMLSACGGGGGGSSSSSSTPASATFPIAQAYASQISNGFSNSVKITGSVNGTSYTGSGTFTVSPATAGTFEKQSGLANTITLTATVTVSGVTQAINTSDTSYSDSNYNPLGDIDAGGAYTVVTNFSALPTTAHVNDTGSISNSTTYTDNTKTTIDSTTVETYVIEPDTTTSAIYDVIDKSYNGSVLTETTHERYRVTTSGAVSFVSLDFQNADGSETEHVVPQ